ncbi:MAG: hypothetical protein ABJ092_10600 [Gillisia sp.]
MSNFFYRFWWLFYLAFFLLLGLLIYSLMYENNVRYSRQTIAALNQQLENCENRNRVVENDSIRVISNDGQFGCLSFTLIWNSIDDLDLNVTDARNNNIYYKNYCRSCENKFSSAGGQLDIDLNAGGVNTSQPVENVYFKCTPPSGIYTVRVHFFEKRSNSPVNYNLLIRNNGRIEKELTGTLYREDEVIEIIRYNYNESS